MKELISDLEHVIHRIGPNECPELLGELERLKGLAHLKMFAGQGHQRGDPQSSMEARYLTVEQVTERFHVTSKWLYRHKKQMPHSQPSRKVLLFPEQAITKWFASQK